MSSRTQHEVKATADRVSVYTAKIALNGVTGTLVNSTDMGTTLTAGADTTGLVTVTLGSDNRYPQLLHWEITPQTNAAYTGIYRLEKVSESATAGTMTFQVLSGSASRAAGFAGVGVPVNAVPGYVGLTGSITAIFRNTDRTR
jgi:hypothetical protein